MRVIQVISYLLSTSTTPIIINAKGNVVTKILIFEDTNLKRSKFTFAMGENE